MHVKNLISAWKEMVDLCTQENKQSKKDENHLMTTLFSLMQHILTWHYCSFWKPELLHSSTVWQGKVLKPLDWNRSLQWVLQEKPNWQTKNKQLMLVYLGGQGCMLQTLCRWAGFKFHWHSDCWTTELSADVTHWYTVFSMPIRKYEFR